MNIGLNTKRLQKLQDFMNRTIYKKKVVYKKNEKKEMKKIYIVYLIKKVVVFVVFCLQSQ